MSGEERRGPFPGSRLYFVGVTTEQSSIRSVFPRWSQTLGLTADLLGRNLPVRASRAECRRVVAELRDDDRAAGALITTHKAAVFDDAGDMFEFVDGYAGMCREVSCVVRGTTGIRGYAKDPVTAGLAMQDIFGTPGWAAGRDVLCFGAGGAGIAISVHLLTRADAPRRIILVDRDPGRIRVAREIHAGLSTPVEVEYAVHAGPAENDVLLSRCSAGALVINATGMGKDLPGSPVSSRAVFPSESVIWDLNYRGDLDFLAVAAAQTSSQALRVVDGWGYFLRGWTEVIAEVFGVSMTQERFAHLAAVAEPLRGHSPQGPSRGRLVVRL